MNYLSSSLGWYASMILLIPAVLFTMVAQWKVSSNYKKYSQIMNQRGITGAQAARRMLDANGLTQVAIQPVSGELTDNFNPGNNTVNLSEGVYNANTVAAIGVACHECGHAIQHAQGYAPLKLRSAVIPMTNIGSSLAIPIFLVGLMLSMPGLETLGIFLFSFAVIFQAITLPVEFDASRRALGQVRELGLVQDAEYSGAKKVLTAAAMTYVAALLMSLLQLVRLILLSRSRR